MNRLTLLKVAFSMKNAKLNVGDGADSVAAVGNEVGGCGVNVGGVGDDIVVAAVAVAAGADAVAFFAGFFLLDGAGIVFGAEFK
jgi:hypothetical protein